ncbi:MAG: DUF6807 family protein [Planctomycetota bacterium]
MLRAAACLALAPTLTLPRLAAQTVTLPVRVRAGAVERQGSPAVASFAWPDELVDALAACETDLPVPWTASLTQQDGHHVACEVLGVPTSEGSPAHGELRFVVESMPADSERAYRLQLGAQRGEQGSQQGSQQGGTFSTDLDGDARELRRGDTPLLRHEFAFDRDDFERTSKPIWHLYVPGTDVLLTKGVGGEYSHHRGLFLGWNKTTVGEHRFDFWHCPTAGLRHTGYDLRREVQSAVRGEVSTGTHWISPLDEPIVRDRRRLTFWRSAAMAGDGGAEPRTLLDVAVELSADQLVALRGDPQHAGFQIRIADEVAQRKDARYVRPASAKGGENDVWTDCPWVAGLFRVQDHDVAVLHMSHPSNPTPMSYSTRDYGRFGSFFEADIAPDTPLTLRYRLLILSLGKESDVSVERFARVYADYVQPLAVSVGD